MTADKSLPLAHDDHTRHESSFPFHAVIAGALAAFVGFASSFAVVVHGLKAVGASEAEAASGLMALSMAMGLGGIILSLKTRMPVSVAWSTPGAASWQQRAWCRVDSQPPSARFSCRHYCW